MESALKSKKFMSKNEVSLLLNLIQKNPILTSKKTDASTNRIKEVTWTNLTRAFNAKSGSVPKTKEQLKLKWDNLKKASRKRAQQLRMDNLKAGGDQDDVLEKVTNLLESTCTGFVVSHGDGDDNKDSEDNSAATEKLKYLFGLKKSKGLITMKDKNKLFNKGQLPHHIAIERYYDLKREKVELEIKLLKIQLAKAEVESDDVF